MINILLLKLFEKILQQLRKQSAIVLDKNKSYLQEYYNTLQNV